MALQAPDIFMLIVLVIGGAAGISVVNNKNVVHSALSLVVVMLSVAASFLLMGAEFLAWTQVLVYAGAVIVLILFGLMLTRAPIGPVREDSENTRLAFAISISLFGFLMSLIVMSFNGVELSLTVTPTIALAEFLYVEWAFPLLAMGFLLTVSLVGAVIIARAEEGEGPLPDEDDYMDSDDAPPITSGDSIAEPGFSDPNEAPAPIGVTTGGRG